MNNTQKNIILYQIIKDTNDNHAVTISSFFKYCSFHDSLYFLIYKYILLL